MANVNGTRAVKARTRTISFYEIVRHISVGDHERMEQIDWESIFRTLEAHPLGDRTHVGALKTLIGDVLPVEGKRALKLMSVRDQNAWLELYDPSADSIDALDLGDSGALLETSIVAFLPYGNVIGLIGGSNSAPRTSALAQWLNGLEILADTVVEIRPMIAHEAQRDLRKAQEVSYIQVSAHTNQADALRARSSGLSGVLDSIRQDYGEFEVEVTLRARKRDDRHARAALKAEAERILSAADEHLIKARAGLVYFHNDETSRTHELDLAKQRITAKRAIPTTADDGSPIRNASAVQAILDVADEYDADLRAIVGAS